MLDSVSHARMALVGVSGFLCCHKTIHGISYTFSAPKKKKCWLNGRDDQSCRTGDANSVSIATLEQVRGNSSFSSQAL